jgi:hypothetical protein
LLWLYNRQSNDCGQLMFTTPIQLMLVLMLRKATANAHHLRLGKKPAGLAAGIYHLAFLDLGIAFCFAFDLSSRGLT